MSPGHVLILVTLLLALFLGWSYSRSRPGPVPLYALALAILASLASAAITESMRLPAATEVLNVVAIAFSLAALPSSPSLWEAELQKALQGTRVYRSLAPGDFRSWRGWLKLVDRIGAARAALVYLAPFALALTAEAAVAGSAWPGADTRGFALVALLAPLTFALLSSLWLYRAARHLIPGA
jgi:hypothetical protein